MLEVGPGTGQVTRRLLEIGAEVVAVEPDARLAQFLREKLGAQLELVERTLEQAELAAGAFDLAVAASSFHWVDEAAGLASLRGALRPGGWIAVWWTSFGDETGPDRFMFPLSSAMPRAYRRPSRWVRSNGPVTQRSSGSGGCTSKCA